MALANGQEKQGGVQTGLGTVTPATIVSYKLEPGIHHHKIVVAVAATGAFRLNYLYTPDGASWYIGNTVNSVGVNVDGGQPGYTQSARIDITVGYAYKVEIFNTTGGNIDFAYDVREYVTH